MLLLFGQTHQIICQIVSFTSTSCGTGCFQVPRFYKVQQNESTLTLHLRHRSCHGSQLPLCHVLSLFQNCVTHWQPSHSLYLPFYQAFRRQRKGVSVVKLLCLTRNLLPILFCILYCLTHYFTISTSLYV